MVQLEKSFSKEVTANVCAALRSKFKQDLFDSNESEIADALACISVRPNEHRYWEKVILGRFSNDIKTFKNLGNETGLTPERVRQILEKYFRVIRHQVEINKLNKKQNDVAPHERSIYALDLNVRTRNLLLENDIRTISDLISLPRERLIKTPGIGPVALNQIDSAMSKLGLVAGSGASVLE